MADPRCDVTELLVSQCGHCKPKTGRTFIAQYPGFCATCSQGIEPGQMIREINGDYEHAGHK